MYTFEQLLKAAQTKGTEMFRLAFDTNSSSLVSMVKRKCKLTITKEQAQQLMDATTSAV